MSHAFFVTDLGIFAVQFDHADIAHVGGLLALPGHLGLEPDAGGVAELDWKSQGCHVVGLLVVVIDLALDLNDGVRGLLRLDVHGVPVVVR